MRQLFICVSWDGRTAECLRNRFRFHFTDADVISDQMPYDFAIVIALADGGQLRDVVVYQPPEPDEVDAVVVFVEGKGLHGFAKPVSKANVSGKWANLYIPAGEVGELQPGTFIRGRVVEVAKETFRLVDVQPFSLEDEAVTESETAGETNELI